MICPCCKQLTNKPDPLHVVRSLEVSEMTRLALELLAKRFDTMVSGCDLADYVFANYWNGGPDDPASNIGVMFNRIKKRRTLEKHGLKVESIPGPGGGRKLTWL